MKHPEHMDTEFKNNDDTSYEISRPSSFLTYRLSRLQARLNAQAADLLRRHGGVPLAQWRVLLLLYGGDVSSQKEIVGLAQFDKGQVSRLVDTLIDRGLISAKSGGDDKRVRTLSLTAEGTAIVERLVPIMRERQHRLLGVFSPEEQALLMEFIGRLDGVADKLDI